MRKFGLAEARRKLTKLVEYAERGEKIGVTKRGKLVAIIGPAADVDLKKLFEGMERIRRRAKPLRGTSILELIREGRQ